MLDEKPVEPKWVEVMAMWVDMVERHRLDDGPSRLREHAYQAIKAAILSGALSPRAPLVEERLAAMLQISRTPIREALAVLEHQGLVEHVPGKGLFVKALAEREFIALLEIIETLTVALAQQVAQGANDEVVAAIAGLLRRSESRGSGDLRGYCADCRASLEHLGRRANPYAVPILLSTIDRVQLYLLEIGWSPTAREAHDLLTQQRSLLDAIALSDGESAVRAVRAYIRLLRTYTCR